MTYFFWFCGFSLTFVYVVCCYVRTCSDIQKTNYPLKYNFQWSWFGVLVNNQKGKQTLLHSPVLFFLSLFEKVSVRLHWYSNWYLTLLQCLWCSSCELLSATIPLGSGSKLKIHDIRRPMKLLHFGIYEELLLNEDILSWIGHPAKVLNGLTFEDVLT